MNTSPPSPIDARLGTGPETAATSTSRLESPTKHPGSVLGDPNRKPGPENGTQPRTILTPRQREILTLAADGLTNAQIGARLNLSQSTIDHLIPSIATALDATTRTHAVATALRTGVIS